MFRIMTPEETHVHTENNYADPTMWGARYQEFLFGGIGTGVAIGDYDGDGKPDIFVVSKTESCRLFRNLGNWEFEDVTEKAGVGDHGKDAAIWKQGVTFADVNNDGKLDIYICRFGAPNLLYINQGDGTFKESAHAYGLDVVDACGMAAFCDYDRDGWLDVYITTNLLDSAVHPRGQRGYLFHNNRDGTFSNVTESGGIQGESESHSATWWDFDGDGWPDLYVANDFGAPDKLYHNNRDGTFTDVLAQLVPHTAFSSMGSDLGDVNNDGREDFLVGDMAATTHELDQRGQAEERAKTKESPNSISTVPKYHRNALFISTGTGRFLEAAYLAGIAATDWTWALRFEDLDNDGRLDLFVTNGMNREENIDVNVRMMSAETTAERIAIMERSPELAQRHLGFRNLGGLQFAEVSKEWGLDQKSVSFGASFGDLDGDGDLDLVYANYRSGVTILRNDSDSGHRVIIDLQGVASNRFGVGAEVQIETDMGLQVRTLTLARGYLSSSEPIVHFGTGEDKIIRRMIVKWPSGRVQTFQNLSVDRHYTVIEPTEILPAATDTQNPQFADVSETLGLAVLSRADTVDELSAQKLLPARLNLAGPSLAIGDLNGTGDLDIIVGGTRLDPLRILHAKPKGLFAVHSMSFASGQGVCDGPVLLFDAGQKGYQDLLITKGGNSLPEGSPEYQPELYLNDGHGGFRLAPDGALPPLPISVGAVAAADFQHTGKLGLFIGARVRPGEYPLPASSSLLVNRGGRFEDVTDTFAPGLHELGLVTSALWSDVDGDGWIDLLVTLEWGTVKYFHNHQGERLEDWSDRAGFSTAGSGWWTSLSTADFNGDGRPDYIAGNVGMNTQYHGDQKHPAVLYSGSFNDDDSIQLIEAYYENDQLYPWRTRRDLGTAIHSILRHYPSANAYARATLPALLGNSLNRAQRFAATELRSGVFLSQPDGAYIFKPLPYLAQIAPLQGIVAGDFDGDGFADIYAVQNSYAPIPSVGHFDGGISQYLRGDGKGNFTCVPARESGLVVPGDAKALAVLDLDQDGWPDFVITRNDNTTVAFRNRGRPDHHSFRIELRGHSGNPTAVGSEITVILGDGTTQTGEVSAGSGFRSQSSPFLFFGYTLNNPPKAARVRWSNGQVTQEIMPSPIPSSLVFFAP